jgi:hypothetical protein
VLASEIRPPGAAFPGIVITESRVRTLPTA